MKEFLQTRGGYDGKTLRRRKKYNGTEAVDCMPVHVTCMCITCRVGVGITI